MLGTECRNITQLTVGGFHSNADPIVDFCIEYGSNLQALYLKETKFETKHVRAVTQACPSLSLDGDSVFHFWLIEGSDMVSMGRSASTLYIHDPDWSDDIARIGTTCPNVRNLIIRTDISVSSLRALFAVPKPMLSKLEIQVQDARILPVVAEEISTLEYLKYEDRCPPFISCRILWLQTELRRRWN